MSVSNGLMNHNKGDYKKKKKDDYIPNKKDKKEGKKSGKEVKEGWMVQSGRERWEGEEGRNGGTPFPPQL